MSTAAPVRLAFVGCVALLATNCSQSTQRPERELTAQQRREIGSFSDRAKYGTASPRVVAEGQEVPKGGGRYHVGPSYRIAGRTYSPRENPNYSATGLASWYGAAFHGRKTANGEVYDKYSFTAAHPTMPLPSYARVTNLGNNRSMIVRVNDRGPFHGNRVIDLSQQVADALQFRHIGTARVKVDYVGRAGLAGSDDRRLMATLRTDGTPADPPSGVPSIMVASAEPDRSLATLRNAPPPVVGQGSATSTIASASTPGALTASDRGTIVVRDSGIRRNDVPLPLGRPFEVASASARAIQPPANSTAVAPVLASPLAVGSGQTNPVQVVRAPIVAPAAIAPVSFRTAAVAPMNPALQAIPIARVNAPLAAQPIQQAAALYFAATDPMPGQQAFRSLSMENVVGSDVRLPKNEFSVLAGVFRDERNARRLAQQLIGSGQVQVTMLAGSDSPLYRVKVTALSSETSAASVAERARAAGAAGAYVSRD